VKDFIETFADYCGPTQYSRFVDALRRSRTSAGRLFYWQEEMLRRFEAEKGIAAPADLESLLALYRTPSVHLPAFIGSATSGDEFLIPAKVRRLFRWVNQNASGGSHVTDFAVALESPDGDDGSSVVDLAAPHQRDGVGAELLRAIAEGVSNFGAKCQSEGVAVRSLRVSLLEYVDHIADLKPRKYAPATFFLLEDLRCEIQCGRFIEVKLVGTPL